MAMQKSLFHKDSRHLTTANAYVSGRRGRRPLHGWRVRFRCRVAISNTPINQSLKLFFNQWVIDTEEKRVYNEISHASGHRAAAEFFGKVCVFRKMARGAVLYHTFRPCGPRPKRGAHPADFERGRVSKHDTDRQ